MKSENYKVVCIRDFFQNNESAIGEKKLLDILSDFSCPLNPSIEKFLKEQAIEFTKKNQSVTYLVFLNDATTLVGYFTLVSKPIIIKEGIFSKTIQRKISRVSEYNPENQTFRLSAYLIAQIGKNFTDNANKKIKGQELIRIAIRKIKELQYMLGGMVMFLETEEKDKLLEFYQEQNGFEIFDTRKNKYGNGYRFVQMLKIL